MSFYKNRLATIRQRNDRLIRCPTCGGQRVIVSSGWSCPLGHGRIVPPADVTVKQLKKMYPDLICESPADNLKGVKARVANNGGDA